MEAISQYLLKVTAAAILCGVVTGFFGTKNMLGTTVKMIAGLFLVLTVVSPWAKIRLDNLLDVTGDYISSADMAAAQGESLAKESISRGIKEQSEAYILDKAESLGAQLTVQVTISDAEFPVPQSVRISGSISPYAKSQLIQIIKEDLGIPVEEQLWIG